MADKPAKNGESAKAEGGEGPKKPALNKQTAKVVQDGVELTWDVQREGDLSSKDAADFYAQSIEALKTFRENDPRTMPELRKLKKAKDDSRKAMANQLKGVLVGIVLVMLFGAFRNCDVSSRAAPHERSRRYYDD